MPETTEIAFVLPEGGEPPSGDHMMVRQRYGNRVVIVTVPAEAVEDVLGATPGELTAASRREEVPEEIWNALGESERLALEAYWLRQSDEYRQEKEERPGQGISWDHPDFAHPDPPGGVDFEAAAPATGLNDRLRGSVAVGLVIVSGPGDLAFSPAQVAKVLAEVQSGLSWLGSQYQLTPVTFTVDAHVIPIMTPSNPDAPDLEGLWRDPAMAILGYPNGAAGVTDFARALKAVNSTDSAYVSFFTHYPLDHFAYAKPWIPETVMQYANDGWGPSNIDSVFAHETGHIFGAPDEYAESKCNCEGSWGYYHIPNLNCAQCSAGVRCIMNGNSWTMCTWTPRHVGAPEWRPGDSYTASMPFVTGDVIYFQGTNNKLYRTNNDGSGGQWLGDSYTASTPFVADNVIYFRGTNDKLYRINTDGSNSQWLGESYTASTPFVAGGVIYFQGTNSKLYRINTDGSGGEWLGYGYAASSLFVSNRALYYRGTDDGLWMVNLT